MLACRVIGLASLLAAALSPGLGLAETTSYQLYTPGMTIERYKPQLMFAYVEYDLFTCAQKSGGSFAIDQQPTYGEISYGTTPVIIGGRYCNGTPATASAVYYKWTMHKNPAATDRFHGTWISPTGTFKPQFTGTPRPPIVRPIGETTSFHGFYQQSNGIWGKWWAALKPPKDDPTFDFDGESIRENYESNVNTCEDRAPGAQGSLSASPAGTQASWEVGKLTVEHLNISNGPKNVYGYDFVGWSKCALEAYRCAGAATPVCGNTLIQRITIHSPADPPGKYFDLNPVKINVLKENIGGRVYPGHNPLRLTDGFFQSQRGAESGLMTYPGAFSDINACSAAAINSSRILQQCRDGGG